MELGDGLNEQWHAWTCHVCGKMDEIRGAQQQMQVDPIRGYALGQWFSTWRDFASQGTPGKAWRHFFIGRWWEHGGGATGILWVESGDVGEHPAMPRIDPTTKTYQAHSADSDRVEKPGSSLTDMWKGRELDSDSRSP